MAASLWQPKRKISPKLWQPKTPLSGRLREFSASPPPEKAIRCGECNRVYPASAPPPTASPDNDESLEGPPADTGSLPPSDEGVIQHEEQRNASPQAEPPNEPIPKDDEIRNHETSDSDLSEYQPSEEEMFDAGDPVHALESNEFSEDEVVVHNPSRNGVPHDGDQHYDPSENDTNAVTLRPRPVGPKKRGRPKGAKDRVPRQGHPNPRKGISKYNGMTKPPGVSQAKWDHLEDH